MAERDPERPELSLVGENDHGFLIVRNSRLRASIQFLPDPVLPRGAEPFGVVVFPVYRGQLLVVDVD